MFGPPWSRDLLGVPGSTACPICGVASSCSRCAAKRACKLFCAAEEGDAEAARRLLEAGVDADETVTIQSHDWHSLGPSESEGTVSALTAAAARGHINVLRALLSGGANPDFQGTAHGDTPLHFACAAGHIECVAALVQESTRQEELWKVIRDNEGATAMMKAAFSTSANSTKVVQLLLAQPGIRKVDLQDAIGFTAFHNASYAGNIALVELLADAGCDVHVADSHGATALDLVAVNKGDRLREEGASELELRKNDEVVAKLQQLGVRRGVLLATEVATAHRAQRDSDTALLQAAQDGDLAAARSLLTAGANVNGPTVAFLGPLFPLMAAAAAGQSELLQLLLDSGAEIETQDERGFTAFHYACMQSNPDCVERLVKAGCNPAHKDSLGQTGWSNIPASDFDHAASGKRSAPIA
jgi:ankyrin repeat protein